MEIGEIIAINVKRLRNGKNLSLGQLAEQAGVSKVMLSQLEKGTSNPTINTVWKLAGALDVPYTNLLELPETNAIHVRKADITELREDKYHVFPYYKKDQNRKFELYQFEMEEGSEHSSIGHSADSTEYIMLVKGEIELRINDEVHVLHEDDGFCFEGTVPHVYKNNKEETAKAVLMISYED